MQRHRHLSSGLLALTLGACAIFAPDAARSTNAINQAKSIPDPAASLTPDQTETHGFDGTSYKITDAGKDGVCLRAQVDNRNARAKTNTFKLRVYDDPSESPLYEGMPEAVSIEREYTVKETGGMYTNQYTMGPDGTMHPGIQVGQVDFPVADLKACFKGAKIDKNAKVLLVSKITTTEGAAASYAAWKVER